MTDRTNPEQTPDMSGPTDEEVEAVARALYAWQYSTSSLDRDQPKLPNALKAAFKSKARTAIRALDKVRRK